MTRLNSILIITLAFLALSAGVAQTNGGGGSGGGGGGATTPATSLILGGTGVANGVQAATSSQVQNTIGSSVYDAYGAAGTNSPGNVLQFACGNTINDGNIHPVNTAGGCFTGVTTLAGLAAITLNGTHPFSFVTDSGTITGPLCTFGTTTNCFTSTGGSYKLTNTMVTNGTIDVAWLASQACALTKNCFAVSGTYKYNLPIMIPIALQNTSGVTFAGAGPQVTIFVPNTDFGAGIPAFSCGDPSATSTNTLGRYAAGNGQCAGNLDNLAIKWTGTAPVIGTPNVNMDGLAWGARLNLQNVEIDNFNHARTIVGDHAKFYNLHEFGNYIGEEFPLPNSILVGNIQYYGLDDESVMYAYSVMPGSTISAGWDQSTYIASPYNFYGEAATGAGCTPILNGAKFAGNQTEFTSIAFIQDGSVLPGQLSNGTSYNDTAACRGIQDVTVTDWFFSFQYTNDAAIHAAFPNYVRRAAIDVYSFDQVVFTGVNNNGGNISPNGGTIGSAKAFFYLQKMGIVTGTGASWSGDADAFISGLVTVPMLYLPSGGASLTFTIDEPGVWNGYLANMSGFNPNGSYTQTTAGDCLEYYAQVGFWANPCGTGNNGQSTPVLGVAKQTGIAAGQATFYVPLCTAGFCPVNMGWSSYPGGGNALIKASTGIRTATFTGGTGGTAGPYNWTATGGGCSTEPTGTITVAGGSISALTVTNIGNHCTGTPSIPLPSGTGLTGASIVAAWPSGMGANANDPNDSPVFGILLQGISGSGPTGNLVDLIRMQAPNGGGGLFFSPATAPQVIFSGAAPAIANGAAAGTSPGTPTITGANMAGVITVTTGTATTASATLATITFNGTVTTAPRACMLQPLGVNAAGQNSMIYSTAPNTAGWTIGVAGSPVPVSTTYTWGYVCI